MLADFHELQTLNTHFLYFLQKTCIIMSPQGKGKVLEMMRANSTTGLLAKECRDRAAQTSTRFAWILPEYESGQHTEVERYEHLSSSYHLSFLEPKCFRLWYFNPQLQVILEKSLWEATHATPLVIHCLGAVAGWWWVKDHSGLYVKMLSRNIKRWGHNSVAKSVLRKCKALGFTPSTTKPT